MTVDALATWPQFIDHIAPVWRALPQEERGVFAVLPTLLKHAAKRGVSAERLTHSFLHRRERLITAAYGDYARSRSREVIYMEHGAGQSYGNGHHAYLGGSGRERVGLFLMPSERAARANRVRWGAVPHAVIGCPKLDAWVGRTYPRHDPPVIAVTFHWNGQAVSPEARSALPHYRGVLPDLARTGWEVIGHAHPRAIHDEGVDRRYAAAGIEVVPDFEDVLERADVLVCDNSSVLFEFAATGRPVVVLNAPWYRRDVEHGMRFWEYADVGVQVDHPGELIDAIDRALEDRPAQRMRRQQVSRAVYGPIDGRASDRAVGAIMGMSARAVA